MTDKNIELLEAELAACREECDSLSKEMHESRKSIRKDALSNLHNARAEFNEANDIHEKADDARDACRAALCSSVIGQREPDAVHEEVKTDIKLSYELKKRAYRKNSPWPAVSMYLLAVVCAVLGAVFKWFFFVLTAVFAALGVVLMLNNNKRVTESHEARKRRSGILAKYKADDEETIKQREAEFLELHRRFTEAEEKERQTAERLAAAGRALESIENRTLAELDFNCGTGEAAFITRRYNEKAQRCQELEAEIEKLKNK